MLPKYEELQVEERGTESHVRILSSQVTDEELEGQLGGELHSLISEGRHVVLDCSNVKMISSAALAMFVNLRRGLVSAQGSLVLTGLSPHIRDMLQYTKLDQILEIRP